MENIIFSFTTKNDGNLAFHVGDDEHSVDANHEKLAQKLGYDKNSLVHMKQIHSNIVHVVDENDNYKNPPTCDALITDKINTPLMVMVADCTPIIFYDATKKVIAVAHAGRQGAFKNIVKNVIDRFKDLYKSKPEDISVKLGTAICCDCYEVGSEIYDEAMILNLDYGLKKQNGRYYLDITKILKQ
ncbi:MAG: laccase domain-containing protein, partial [Campylobacterales bacterium]|nr:laccase domain-containing protein [Campylobacterales bacterium]